MRIAIAGSQGTGKSTLARLLAEKLGLPLITERARLAAREMGLGDLSVLFHDREQAIRFQERILALQHRAETSHEQGFVSDRSMYDVLAYCHFYGIQDSDWYRVATGWVAKRAAYHAIIYVPVQFAPADDGFRFTCPGCQRYVDELLQRVLREEAAGERIITLTEHDVASRLAQAMEALGKVACAEALEIAQQTPQASRP